MGILGERVIMLFSIETDCVTSFGDSCEFRRLNGLITDELAVANHHQTDDNDDDDSNDELLLFVETHDCFLLCVFGFVVTGFC